MVTIIPNHICPVMDLVDTFVAIASDGTAEVWRVDARGRSG
jgi:D-serine deaminase-like pyridoxal phosphate-dependent protein